MKRMTACVSIFIMFLVLTGFGGPKGKDPEEKRQAIQKMRQETLAKLYEYDPYSKHFISKAAGYAVFSNTGINLFQMSPAPPNAPEKDLINFIAKRFNLRNTNCEIRNTAELCSARASAQVSFQQIPKK